MMHAEEKSGGVTMTRFQSLGFGGNSGSGSEPQFRAEAAAVPTSESDGVVSIGLPGMMPTQFGDVIDVLPPEAAERLRDLRQQADDLLVLNRSSFTESQDLQVEIHKHKARISQLTLERGAGGYGLGADAPQVRDEETRLSRKIHDLARQRELAELRGGRFQNLRRLISACEGFLRSGIPPGTVVAALPETEPHLRKNETPLQAIERLRYRLGELDADARKAEAVPIPSSVAKARMREQLSRLAEQGAPSVLRLVELGTELEFATTTQRLPIISTSADFSFAQGEAPDAIGMLLWAFRDVIIGKIDALIDRDANDGEALTDAARAELLARIAEERLQTEFQDCALVRLAQSQGTLVEFRSDTSVCALLNIELVAAPPSPPDPDGGKAGWNLHIGP
jgi:hypothetical protein